MDKWTLWTATAPMLRGANVFQRWLGDTWCSDFGKVLLKQLKDEGATYVNFSIPGTFNIEPAAPPGPTYSEVPYAANRLNQILQWAKEVGLYSVISFRSGPGRSETDLVKDLRVPIVRDLFVSTAAQDAFVAMWRTVASRYRGESLIAAYDLLVEPHKAECGDEPLSEHQAFLQRWREIATRTVEAIRDVDRDTPIIVGVTEYSGFRDLANWEPLFQHDERNELRVVYGIHQYEPYGYTNDPKKEEFDPTFSGLYAAFDFVDDWRNKYPSFNAAFAVNEFGLVVTRPGAITFLAEELALLHGHRKSGPEQPGISYAAWLWENAGGACFDGAMSLSADPEILFTLREHGWCRR